MQSYLVFEIPNQSLYSQKVVKKHVNLLDVS